MTLNQKKIVLDIIIVGLLAGFAFCAYNIYKKYTESNEELEMVSELKDKIKQPSSDKKGIDGEKGDSEADEGYYLIDNVPVQAKFKDLYLENKDFVGWITMDGIPVDYPVMQTPQNEEKYLRRNFYGEYSTAGTMFAGAKGDLNTPSDCNIIFGHNMHTGIMFGQLKAYVDKSFYDEHPYFEFDTLSRNGKYQIIAAFKTEIQPRDYKGFIYYQFYTAKDEEEFNNYVANIKQSSIYDTGVTAQYGEKLLVLSTCSKHKNNGRFVVVAKMVASEEINTEEKPIEVINNGS